MNNPELPQPDYAEPAGQPVSARVRRVSEAIDDPSVDPEVRRALEIARRAFGDDITVESIDTAEHILGTIPPEA